MEEDRPKLHDVEAFRKALVDYKVSKHAHEVLDGMKFVVVSGIAGGGRNTVINRLVEDYGYFFVISDTTRPPKVRDGAMEQNGVQYYFRSEEDMLRDIQNGEFIEAEIIHEQQVSGTSIRELERAKESGKTAIHDFEFGGANNVARVKADAFIIGLLPPNYDEWIRRLKSRETMSDTEFMSRMRTAKKVIGNMLEHTYFRFVISDDIDKCAETIRNIVEHDAYDDAMAERGRQVAEELRDKIVAVVGEA